MTAYIQELRNRFIALKSGINLNTARWVGQPVQEADVDTMIATLTADDAAIDVALDQVQQLRNAGRASVQSLTLRANQIENLAIGIHASDPALLNEYDIKLRAPGQAKPAPAKAVVKSINDDTDGMGFILQRDPLENADNYEWQRAKAPVATANTIDPALFVHHKTTKKVKFVDDDVLPGERYFYRVRGFNATGNGAWSEPVSRVQ